MTTLRDDSRIQAVLFTAAQYEVQAAEAKYDAALERKRPFSWLRPKLFPDGNQWCVLYGENIQDGLAAFGDTPEKAALAFDLAWLNERANPNS